MPIGRTSGNGTHAVQAAHATVPRRAASTLIITSAPDLTVHQAPEVCVDLPAVRQFQPAVRPITDEATGSGQVRRSSGFFRHLKGCGRSPHFPGILRNSGQNASQRTIPGLLNLLIIGSAGSRRTSPLAAAPKRRPCARTTARPHPCIRPRSRAPPPRALRRLQPRQFLPALED